ncbi:MAG TPA: glycoside hydrolase family 2 TIM barrel-domain containing protein, partial [Jiangellaceae bacterium]|nr:glycoside hydrolase family 2 TIM barrel-domain containing protein [Jiangellaceae bacterium]
MTERATQQDGTYPRPQLVREQWTDLTGTWQFRHDNSDTGRAQQWHLGTEAFERAITVPYPPESTRSGVANPGPHPVVWYRRTVSLDSVDPRRLVREHGHRLRLSFGAVDHRAQVWVNGHLVVEHVGGHTPFSVDISHALLVEHDVDQVIVVRAEDDPRDVGQPRGKQDWHDDPHKIWYRRTTGIWQPVWAEVVPPTHLTHLVWTPDITTGLVHLEYELSTSPAPGTRLEVTLIHDDRHLASASVVVGRQRGHTAIALDDLGNGHDREHLLWSPEHPVLIDAEIRVGDDEVRSYLGLRSTDVDDTYFLLNHRPYPVRSVLEQGYWPDTHLAAPNAAALRREVELIKELGFNAARIHQKVEDPRFLYWADRLGLLVWGEIAAPFEFSRTSIEWLTGEWMETVRRDAGHPCVVTWVPINESWGAHLSGSVPAQASFTRALAALTRALDPTRPVISNDGWEHTDSDIWAIHDYTGSGQTLTERYHDDEAFADARRRFRPGGRRMLLAGAEAEAAAGGRRPVMLTEFGGLSYAPEAGVKWYGYSTVHTEQEFLDRLRELYAAVHGSRLLVGSCYTQLTDTMQETNGLLDENRRPKLPVEQVRAIVTG